MTDLKTQSVPGLERGLCLLEMLSESLGGLRFRSLFEDRVFRRVQFTVWS